MLGNRMRIVAFIMMVVALGACQTPEILEQGPNSITLSSKGSSQRVYDEAKKHCAEFGKKSHLITRDLITKTYTFFCE